ncbi:UMP-CMP kinase 2, mitochondrial [Rhinophrynus dorsalis]
MASSLSQSRVEWKKRIFAVDANASLGYTDPFYFTAQENRSEAYSVTSHEWPMITHGVKAHSVCVTVPQRITAARLHKSLGRQLTHAFPGCQLLRFLSYLPHEIHGSLVKGYMILDSHNCPNTQTKLRDLLSEYHRQIIFCSYQQKAGGEIWQCLWDLNGQGKETEQSLVVRVEEPLISPFVVNIQDTAVFYTLDDACAVLQECYTFIPEAKSILELLDRSYTEQKKGNFPVIVIEGLDATGKTTLTHSLKDSLKGVLLKSPPDCIDQWRKRFDEEPSLIKRAYYAVGNYIGAADIAKASLTSPVIMDRYWHSTAAYAIATETGGSVHNLPKCHHEVYQWPSDLLKPDIVILLTVCDKERVRRMRTRGLKETKEEKELESNSAFRQKVEEAYKRMENPRCVIIDASSSKETVLKEALSIIKKYCAS